MLRLILATLGGRRGEVFALALLTVLTMAIATAAPLLHDEADRRAFTAELEAATPEQRSITATAVVLTGGLAFTLADLRARTRATHPDPALTEISGVLVRPASTLESPLVAREGFCAHLVLTGACPQRAGEVVAAQASGFKVGDTVTYPAAGREEPLRLTVTGVYDPSASVTDAFWAGRAEVTPGAVREGNPLFTPPETFSESGLDSAVVMVDLVAERGSLTLANIEAITSYSAQQVRPAMDTTNINGLAMLMQRIELARDELRAAVGAAAVQLIVLCWLVLLLAVHQLAVRRRPEVALGGLRGVPRPTRLLLAQGPTALVLLAAAPVGGALGWATVSLLARRPVAMTVPAWALAGIVLLAAIVSAAVAERRAHKVPLLEAMREVPARQRWRGALAVEGSVVALALVSITQSRDETGAGLAILTPLCLATVFGLLLARLIGPAAGLTGLALMKRRRLGRGLAVLYLARRPGADRLATLIVIAVALLTHAAISWDAVRLRVAEEAATQLGADRVLTVQARSRAVLLNAVRAVDPQGQWAMAVARQGSSLVAVDSARLARVARWPGGADPAEVARLLRPNAMEPIIVTGQRLALHTTVTSPMARAIPVTAMLYGPDGERVTGILEIATEAGKHVATLDVPACAHPPGCRLAWLSFPWSPDQVVITGLAQLGPDRAVAEPIAQTARWRSSFGRESEIIIEASAAGLRMRYVPSGRPPPAADARIQAADAPVPLPAVVKGEPELMDTRQSPARSLFTGRRLVEVALALPDLPGLAGGSGTLVDMEYADRLSDSFDNAARLEVWLNDTAPSDVDKRLREHGVVTIAQETIEQRTSRYRFSGSALGEAMRLGAGAAGVVLTALALLLVAATDRRRRLAELESLRYQGVSAAEARRALGGLGVVVACAMPAGIVAGVVAARLSGAGAPMVTVAVATALAVAVLGGAAGLAKRAGLAKPAARPGAAAGPGAATTPAERGSS